MFLWCSVPDEELLSLAINQKLGTPEVLEQQVVRMLSDRRSSRFARQFVMQWLGMQTLDIWTLIERPDLNSLPR